jgi:Nuclease-related domain
MLNLHTQESAFRTGAEGEEMVARRLAKLNSDWHVLHAVPVGDLGSDIDHVVVGPSGVFTLNTKNHAGKNVWVAKHAFMVNGQRTNYLQKSRFEAQRTSRLLSSACGFAVTVDPVIVVIASQLKVKHAPSGVHVVGRKRIARWLRHQPPVLTSHRIEEIFDQARMASTWTSTGKGRRPPS